MHERLIRALSFIENNLEQDFLFPSFVADSREMQGPTQKVKEYFTTALVAMALEEGPIVERVLDNFYQIAQKRLFTFYPGPVYPPDTDTNSLIFSLLILHGYEIEDQALYLIDQIKKYSIDGIAGVWICGQREQRLDPIVSINAQILATLLGKGDEFPANKGFIINHLISNNYLHGTRYYHSPDTFLYFLARLAELDLELNRLINNKLTFALKQRLKSTCHPLDLAQRMIVGNRLGIDIDWEMEKLLSLQKNNGSLPMDAMFRLGSGKGYFGSPVLTTAFFIQALKHKN